MACVAAFTWGVTRDMCLQCIPTVFPAFALLGWYCVVCVVCACMHVRVFECVCECVWERGYVCVCVSGLESIGTANLYRGFDTKRELMFKV